MRGFDKIDRKFLKQLFFYHFLIAIAFHFYIANFGGDATYYWEFARDSSLEDIMEIVNRGSATGVLYLINYLPANIFQLSFFTGNMMYALLGYVGFVYIYKTLKDIFGDLRQLFSIKLFGISIHPWIWFLPNLHFWSSGIGKDTILFFCIAVFIFCIQKVRTRLLGLLVSIIISLAIRPHITLFLLVSFGIGYMIDGRLKGYQKALLFMVFLVGFISIFNYVLEFVQLESLETSAIDEYASTKAANLNKAQSGSGIDISSYPFPLKVFTFLYRPLFFDINGILAVLASIENLILLLFTVAILRNKPFAAFKGGAVIIKSMLLYFIMGAVSFSLILGNLGIMLRQKNMFIPYFIIFGLWVLYFNKKKSLNRL